jgi:hypothetical protein
MPLTPLDIVEYVRKELIVKAVKVAEENMELVAQWCGGEICMTTDRRFYVKVPVPKVVRESHSYAYVGHYVVFAGQSFKVFTEKNLVRTFDPKADAEKLEIVEIENLDYNENTLFKVNNALMAVGLSERDAHIAINNMQNEGILFRERGKRHVPGEPQKQYSVVRHGPDDVEVYEDHNYGARLLMDIEHESQPHGTPVGPEKYTQNTLFDSEGNLVPTDRDGRPYLTIDDAEIYRAQDAGTNTLLNENLAPSIAGDTYPHGA